MPFEYNKSELPKVEKAYKHRVGTGDFHQYYDVGSWTFSVLDAEDGDIEATRKSVLAWIAWYNFLEKNPGIIVKE